MNKKLKEIEKESSAKALEDRYRATCETIALSELAIKFLETREGQELSGSKIANEEILKYKELIRRKVAEKNFMENLLE